ncbi:MAG TPA: NAD(P)-dependent oxidoreductase [Pyrinomonadaceae bacterium]|nr:NAD(P)-dependent oxidoreductase [Pyrinomonadaceae bacterium]
MITILGASGFIGSHLAARLQQYKLEFQAVKRNEPIPDGNLGNVIYCIGVTADFRSKPFETVDAHVCTLLDFVREQEFDSLLYLSSTRLYAGADSTAEEAALRVRPESANDLYNLSKLMGESITLNCGRTGRVARIANVYGLDFKSDNFLPSILRQAATGAKIVFETAPESEKDYVWVHEVVENLIWIAAQGKQQIYNVASGVNVSNAQLAARLQQLTGCEIEFAPGVPAIKYPRINIDRVRGEFGIVPSSVLDDLEWLLKSYKNDQH